MRGYDFSSRHELLNIALAYLVSLEGFLKNEGESRSISESSVYEAGPSGLDLVTTAELAHMRRNQEVLAEVEYFGRPQVHMDSLSEQEVRCAGEGYFTYNPQHSNKLAANAFPRLRERDY